MSVQFPSSVQYSIFVIYSFSENDTEIMFKLLMLEDGLTPILERVHGFQLILHQRDFMPGRPILTNIAEAIQQSRRMIMLLSR